MTISTPPGWYPDPQAAGYERFWDGREWSARSRPLPAVPVPPALPVPPAPGPGPGGSVVSDASPAYGHPAVPEQVMAEQLVAERLRAERGEGTGYGFPPAQPPGPGFGYPAPPAGVPYAPPPPYPPAEPKRTGLGVGLLAGALVLVVLVAGVSAVLLRGTAGHRPTASAPAPIPTGALPSGPAAGGQQPVPQSPVPATPGAPGTPGTPVPSSSPVRDQVHGWTVPVPSGWTTAEHDQGTTVLLVTGPYRCANPEGCVRGNFSIDAAPTAGTDAESVARQTMASYAPQLFGPLTSHQELASGPTTVAGLAGFAVRWRVVPQQGTAGFLLLVAVPSPNGGYTTMVGSADDDPGAPPAARLDQIVSGIVPVTLPNAA
ncbi:DUF2510 domain-containing protein [Kitasatospora sp. NPDC006697]|uniref:DUF2510 domain-containing protein n=1 Tax=Kitasatospora sp. NPDC006697 TaxID=3364020 RepID=UPI0036C522DE